MIRIDNFDNVQALSLSPRQYYSIILGTSETQLFVEDVTSQRAAPSFDSAGTLTHQVPRLLDILGDCESPWRKDLTLRVLTYRPAHPPPFGSMIFPMNSPKSDGVLLVAHGTINNLDELPSFLAQIRHGRPPTEAMVREMSRRYATIGGSPLMRITQTQANALADALQMPVLIGMRFGIAPLAAALRKADALKLHRLVVLPMAPFSTELYATETAQAYSRLRSEGHCLDFNLLHVEPWGSHKGLIQAHCGAIISHLGGQIPTDTCIVVTAHSLPLQAIQAGDNYANQIDSIAQAIQLALGRPIVLAYQSQGQDSIDWLGPNLADKLAKLAKDGVTSVVVAPVGFLSEHVETLYDLDHEAQELASRLGLKMSRVSALNADARLVSVMADVVEKCILRADTSAARSPIL